MNKCKRSCTAKHIFLGSERIVTKLNSANHPTYSEESASTYYYHSDHLGSASVITDNDGREYERIEYTPYGEVWIDKASATYKTPYRFTGKERDEETGLYYFGERYYDGKVSRWLSTDPALGEYVSPDFKAPAGNKGIFEAVNFNLYHYGGNAPVRFVDPDGRMEREENGKLISESTGKYEYKLHEEDKSLIPKKMEVIKLKTDNGKEITAYSNQSSDSRYKTDCHGNTFADGEYWINNDQVEDILNGDNYTDIEKKDVKSGDIAIWRQDGEVKHSAKVTEAWPNYDMYQVENLAGLDVEATPKSTKELTSFGDLKFYRKNK